MKEKKGSIKKLVLKVFVSCALLVYILLKIDRAQLIKNISMMDVFYIPLIVIFIVLNYVISSYRWKQLLVHQNSKNATWGYLTGLYFIGSFFNNFMPTSIGGDVYKIFKLGKKINDNTVAFTSTFMERFTGVLVLALFTLLSFAGYLRYTVVFLVVWFVVALWFGLIVLKYLGDKFKAFNKLYQSIYAYKDHKRVMVLAMFFSVIVQLLSVLTQYAIFFALGVNINFLFALFAFPVITLATFFIPSLNGIGVQDALYIQFFQMAGVPIEVSLAASVLYHIFRLGVSLVGGVLYATGKAD